MKILRSILQSNSLFFAIVIGLNITNAYAQNVLHNGNRVERGVLEMYEEDDLGACSLFAGNFINFGYWPNIKNTKHITGGQRIESSKNLYRLVAKSIEISPKQSVLEVGCGQGVGATLILKEFAPGKLDAIDFSKSQIQRAQKYSFNILKDRSRLCFRCASAEELPYGPSSFDKVISIEAAQHFADLKLFCLESFRVLKPGGKLAVTTFFANSADVEQSVSSMIQTVADGIDKMNAIDDAKKMLQDAGYKNIKVESIGENVWPYFDKWVEQGNLKNSWTRNWYKAYQKGLIDYYLITGEKSENFASFPL